MRFIPGLLVGYCIRGKQRLLIGTLTAIAIIVFIVVPAIALSLLALDVRRERLSRPPQTLVPVVVGLNYETAQIRLREANLKVRVLANRHDLSLESGIVITQTPQAGELTASRLFCKPCNAVTQFAEAQMQRADISPQIRNEWGIIRDLAVGIRVGVAIHKIYEWANS